MNLLICSCCTGRYLIDFALMKLVDEESCWLSASLLAGGCQLPNGQEIGGKLPSDFKIGNADFPRSRERQSAGDAMIGPRRGFSAPPPQNLPQRTRIPAIGHMQLL